MDAKLPLQETLRSGFSLDSDTALARRRGDAVESRAVSRRHGGLHARRIEGRGQHFDVDVSYLSANASAIVWRLDETHGNVIAGFNRMGVLYVQRKA